MKREQLDHISETGLVKSSTGLNIFATRYLRERVSSLITDDSLMGYYQHSDMFYRATNFLPKGTLRQ